MRSQRFETYPQELEYFKEQALWLVKTEEAFAQSNFRTTYDIANIDYDLSIHEKQNNNRLKNYPNLKVIKEAYERVKKLEYSLDIKYWDMLYFVKTIIMIKMQEVNQDDVYEIYIHYDKAFKGVTDQDKLKLKYLRTDFICWVLEVFNSLNIRYNKEKFEKCITDTLKQSSPIDFIKFVGFCTFEFVDHKMYEEALNLADEIGVKHTNFLYSNVLLNLIRTGINSQKLIFKSKAAVILKDRIAYVSPIAKGNDRLMVEMTALYQFLLQKLKLEGDRITYKKHSEEAIRLMIMHYPKNPDILTTYLTIIDICGEQNDKASALEISKRCLDYTFKYFPKYSLECSNALTVYCNALYNSGVYKELEKETLLLREIAQEIYKSDILSFARISAVYVEALFICGKFEEGDKELENLIELFDKCYDGQPNAEAINTHENVANKLFERGYFDKAIQKIGRAMELQKAYQGETSVKYNRLKALETKYKDIKIKTEEKDITSMTGVRKTVVIVVSAISVVGLIGFIVHKLKK